MNDPAKSVNQSERPTRIRWTIVGCLTLVMMLTYLDRLNLSIAGKYIQDEFSISTQTMGWVFSAFLLGYALFQIPGGWAGDRFGARNLLTIAIVWWSAFTALTALAPNLILARWFGVAGSLMIVRFLVGVGESSSSPNANKIVGHWMGSAHRATGSSFTLMGIGLSGALTPSVIAWIMQRWGVERGVVGEAQRLQGGSDGDSAQLPGRSLELERLRGARGDVPDSRRWAHVAGRRDQGEGARPHDRAGERDRRDVEVLRSHEVNRSQLRTRQPQIRRSGPRREPARVREDRRSQPHIDVKRTDLDASGGLPVQVGP